MNPVKYIRARTVVLATKDIDTDQIIAARFLTTTTRDGLGKNLFYDLRHDKNGSEKPDFVLNRSEAKDCGILIGGNNFGCGSSREHAPWALLDYGFKAVISTEIADIFRNNALKNGLLAITVDAKTHQWLLDNQGVELTIDVARQILTLPDGSTVPFPLDGFAKHCLVEGVDQLGFLRSQSKHIDSYEGHKN